MVHGYVGHPLYYSIVCPALVLSTNVNSSMIFFSQSEQYFSYAEYAISGTLYAVVHSLNIKCIYVVD